MDNVVQPDSPTPLQPTDKLNLWLVAVLLLLSTTAAFVGGYFFKSIDQEPPSQTYGAIPSPNPNLDDEPIQLATPATIGGDYYDDTIMAVTSETPRRLLVATVSRKETEQGAIQGTRVSFFDGHNWTRKILSEKEEDLGINTNSLLEGWKIEIDPSRVLRQTVSGRVTVDETTIGFETGELTNNIGMRSLPGYTKFMSTQDGMVNIDGVKVKAKILYTRIYSSNAAELQFYETPFGLTTNWLAFWDREGNFYHIDRTQVDKATDKYQTHQIGVKVAKDGGVYKTFVVEVTQGEENPPASYEIKLGAPINETVQFVAGESINKAPSNAYQWFMSEGEGQIDQSVSGYGVVEYIHN